MIIDTVLEKLRKDYGVKVVATREYPGANLIINCDDYSVQENSLCTRQSLQAVPQLQHVQQSNHYQQELQQQQRHQQQQPQQPPQPELIQNTHAQYSPYQYTSTDEHTTDGQSQSNEHPQIPGTNQRAEPGEPLRGYYETRDGETRVVNQDSASNVQGFGNKEINTHSENTYQSGVDNQAEQLVSARANESKEEHERQEAESGRGF